VYVAPRTPKAFRPPQELKGFAKVHLPPGESATVEVELDARAFARWAPRDPAYVALAERQAVQAPFMSPPTDVDQHGWVVDPGAYGICIGRSSAEIVHVVDVEVG
jgi:beta-glucosidase